MTNSTSFFFTRPILPAGSGVTSKRRRRLYSASLPNLLRSEDCGRDFFMRVLASYLMLGFGRTLCWASTGLRLLFQVEDCHYGRMITRSNLTIDRALRRLQRFTRQNVIEPPADIALTHVTPRCPPSEQILVIGVQRTPNIYKTLRQDALEHLPLLRPLPHERRVALFRVKVTLAAGIIDISTENDSTAT